MMCDDGVWGQEGGGGRGRRSVGEGQIVTSETWWSSKMHDIKNTCNKLHKVVFSIKSQAKKQFEHFCAIQLITIFLPLLFAQRLTCTPFTLFKAQIFFFLLVVWHLCHDQSWYLFCSCILRKLCQTMFSYFLPGNLSKALPVQQTLFISYSLTKLPSQL